MPEQKELEPRRRSIAQQASKVSTTKTYRSDAIESDDGQQWNFLKDMFAKATKTSWENTILKTAIKLTLTKAVDDKVHEKTMMHISFPKR